jgi:hypothetical protein
MVYTENSMYTAVWWRAPYHCMRSPPEAMPLPNRGVFSAAPCNNSVYGKGDMSTTGNVEGFWSLVGLFNGLRVILSNMMFHTRFGPAGRHHGSEGFPGRSSHHEGNEASKLGTAVGYVLVTCCWMYLLCLLYVVKLLPQNRWELHFSGLLLEDILTSLDIWTL